MTVESNGQQATDEPGGMMYDLLRETADKIDEGLESDLLYDINGNAVGSWRLDRD